MTLKLDASFVIKMIEARVEGKTMRTLIFDDTLLDKYSTNHIYLHRPNAFGFWQTRLHLCYETLKRVSNFSELA